MKRISMVLASGGLLAATTGCGADPVSRATLSDSTDAPVSSPAVSNGPVTNPTASNPAVSNSPVSNTPANLTTPPTKESVSLVCLVDVRSESQNEVLLARKIVDTTTGVTKAFDQLGTHTSKSNCENYKDNLIQLNRADREKRVNSKSDIRDSFLCVRDISSENSKLVHLVRATRDANRGVVGSLLAVNEFDQEKYCTAQLD